MQISEVMRIASRAMAAASRRGVAREGAGGGEGHGTPAADGDDPVVGRDHVPGPGEEERGLAVGHHEEGLEPPQAPVGAPLLGELDRGALEVAAVLLEPGLEPVDEGHRVGGGAGEAGQHLPVVQALDLLRAVLHHRLAEGDLAVPGEGDRPSLADGEDRGPVESWLGGAWRDLPVAGSRG